MAQLDALSPYEQLGGQLRESRHALWLYAIRVQHESKHKQSR
jgi:hypothetical protein